MEELATIKRRDMRYTLRKDRAFAEFDDPADGVTRWYGHLNTLSAAGIAILIDAGFDTEEGTILRGVVLRVGDCRLEGSIMVKNIRPVDDVTSLIGGLFYPGTEAESHSLMALIAGMDSVDPDPVPLEARSSRVAPKTPGGSDGAASDVP